MKHGRIVIFVVTNQQTDDRLEAGGHRRLEGHVGARGYFQERSLARRVRDDDDGSLALEKSKGLL